MRLLKKIFRYFFIALAILIGAILLFVAVSVIPVDRTPYQDKPFYAVMMQRLDSLRSLHLPRPQKKFSIGFSKENITPSFRTATAGYGNRKGKLFTSVHDSVYVRTMVMDNGTHPIAIVSADLLIIPPTVTAILEQELPEIGFDLSTVYLSASHTHNSIGNWGEGATRFIYGAYNDSVVHFIANRIKASIVSAMANRVRASLKAGTIPVGKAVRNRLDGATGVVDSLLRVIEVHREDSTRLLMMSYTAHATCLYSRDLEISRDYPGKLVDEVERNGYDFAMFLSGAVGSHGTNAPEYGWDCIDWMAEQITQEFLAHRNNLRPVDDSTLAMIRIPLALGEPQVKIAKDWRIRPWLFNEAFGEYPAFITGLRLGDIILLGTPCDFSGELTPPLDSVAQANDVMCMVTSFNGSYIGYITADRHYDRDHYETRLMNWYGPGNGKYFSECLTKVIEALAN